MITNAQSVTNGSLGLKGIPSQRQYLVYFSRCRFGRHFRGALNENQLRSRFQSYPR